MIEKNRKPRAAKQTKEKVKSKAGGSGQEKLTHVADDTTLQTLMIGTETGLRTPGFPQERAILYGSSVKRLDILVVGRGTSQADLSIGRHTTVIDALRPSYLSSLWAAIARGRAILKEGGDWIITTQDPFEIGFIGWVLSVIARVPLHLQIHTDPGSDLWKQESIVNRIRGFLYRFLTQRAGGIRVVSERVKRELLSRGIPEDRITRVAIVTDPAQFQSPSLSLRETYKDAAQIIVAMGRFEHEKGFDILLRALARVRKTFSGAQLLLVGRGSEEKALRRLAYELGIFDAVRFIPWARDLVAYYRDADAIVVPSLYEGWGLVPVEALVAGGYVVMTDVGCAGEVIVDGSTGVVVPPNDFVALSKGIERMFTDKALKASIDAHRAEAVDALVTKGDFYRLQKESWEKTLARRTHATTTPTNEGE